jgi:hypothetical protein
MWRYVALWTVFGAGVAMAEAPKPDGSLGEGAHGGGAVAAPLPLDRDGQVAAYAAWPARPASEVPVIRRSETWYPPKARKLEGTHLCKVEVYVDHLGYARDAVVWDCDVAFHGAAMRSVLDWRWEPPVGVEKGSGVKVAYEIRFRRP